MKENIFSNFYSKVLSFFTAQKDDEESARDTASNRLKLVLMQDRSNLDGATMQKMREQLIAVISKYIEIDTEALDLNLEGDGEEIALMLNIPVIRARTKEEIEEIEAQEQAKIESQEDSEEELSSEEQTNDENSDVEQEENVETDSDDDTENEDTESENVEDSKNESKTEQEENEEEETDSPSDESKVKKNKKK